MASPASLGWIEEKLGLFLTRNARGIAAWRGGKLLGVVAYDQWSGNSVTAHMAVDEPIAWRRLLPHVFREPFKTRGVLLGVIAEGNKPSRTLVHRFGFKETHRIKDAVKPGEALIVYEMRREDCRFLEDTT